MDKVSSYLSLGYNSFNMSFYLRSYWSILYSKARQNCNYTMLKLSSSLATLNSQDDSRDRNRVDLHTKGSVCSIPSSTKGSCFFLCFHLSFQISPIR